MYTLVVIVGSGIHIICYRMDLHFYRTKLLRIDSHLRTFSVFHRFRPELEDATICESSHCSFKSNLIFDDE